MNPSSSSTQSVLGVRHLSYGSLAEVSITEQILLKFPKFPDLLGEVSMRKQCVPGSFVSAHTQEPGNEAKRVTHNDMHDYFILIFNTAFYLLFIYRKSVH